MIIRWKFTSKQCATYNLAMSGVNCHVKERNEWEGYIRQASCMSEEPTDRVLTSDPFSSRVDNI